MDALLDAYKSKQPEIVFEWSDSETDARGWVVINSLRGGAAGGGTRMRKGLNRHEVVSLAKVMEIKFTVSGPAIGGAKSGIDFDPSDPRRREVLKRWYRAVSPLLKHYYGTGGDLNVDEVKDVIPITEEYGLWHPQEGIVNGHFNPRESEKIHKIGQLRQGVSKKVEDPKYTPDVNEKFLVADLITGYGVAESIRHYYDVYKKENLQGKRVIVQGWGNVSAPAAYYLAENGARVVGIIDRDGGLISEEGFDVEAVRKLVLGRDGNKLQADNMLSFDEVNEKIWSQKADIFIPGAASRLVTLDHLKAMQQGGLQVISAGANVPFADEDIFYGPTAQFADENFSVIPDFIANCGMARTFGYLMMEGVEISDEAIFSDISNTIKKALESTHASHDGLNLIAKTGLHNALKNLI
jgi:glutamate dehydrogenase/leucine dehydrogenase